MCDIDYRSDVHQSLKRDNKKENDEIKKWEITRKH